MNRTHNAKEDEKWKENRTNMPWAKGVDEVRNTHDPRTAAVSSLPSLHLPALRLLAVAALLGFASAAAPAEDWYRIESGDGKASVLFPNRAEEVREQVDKTPGGKVVTRVAEHQDESVMLTISETELPRLAMSFASVNSSFGLSILTSIRSPG